MTVGMSGYLPDVVSQVSAVGSAVSALGSDISGAASSGDFAQVLAAVQSVENAMALANGEVLSSGSGQSSGTGSGSVLGSGSLGASGSGSGGQTGGYSAVQAQLVSGTGYAGGYNSAGGIAGTGSGTSSGAVTSSLLNAGVPANLVPVFEQAAANNGISPIMLAAVSKVESGFDPSAVSSAGAEGIMQIMPSLAAEMGINAYDPVQAINAGAAILSSNLKMFGNSVPLALAAYNAGQGAVQQYGGVPPYPQTQNYVKMVEGVMSQMEAG
ncbi:MAG: lytic transglycosylase domain-containing protein [Actinobacteria bacterium]|nr:lytic transglycosylase domain-containing protein [Actinomycetota bacterium]